MNRKLRNIITTGVVIVIIVAFLILKNVDKSEKRVISGLVKDKTDSEGKNNFIIETFGENQLEKMTFVVNDDDLWENIKIGDYCFLIYKDDGGDLVVLDVEKNENFKKNYEEYITKVKKKKEVKEEEQDKDITKKEKQKKEKSIAIFPSSDKTTTTDLTLLDSTKVDIYGDKEEKSIELYTTAQRDSNNDEIMWDDGQRWFLLVRDDEKEFVLFDDYVQLGVLEFWVFTSEGEYHIVTLQTGSAIYKLSDYTYDKEKGAFIRKDIFNPEFLNIIYGSTIK